MGNQRQFFVAVVFLTTVVGYFIHKKFFRQHKLTTMPTEFVGTWKTDCIKQNLGPTVRSIKIKQSKEYEVFETVYFDSECKDKAIVNRYVGVINLDYGKNKNEYNVIYQNSGFSVMLMDIRAVKAAKKTKLHGIAEWRIADWFALKPALKISWDIVKYSGDALFFGDPKSGDQTSRKTRPTKYETFGYNKTSNPVVSEGAQLAAQAMPDCIKSASLLYEKARKFQWEFKSNKSTMTSYSKYSNKSGKHYDNLRLQFNSSRMKVMTSLAEMENIVRRNRDIFQCLADSCQQQAIQACKLKDSFDKFRHETVEARRGLH